MYRIMEGVINQPACLASFYFLVLLILIDQDLALQGFPTIMAQDAQFEALLVIALNARPFDKAPL